MYRLFVAIDLPPQIKDQLRRMSGGVPGAHWLEAPQMHLTLRFIGEVDGGVFQDALDALREVRSDPFELTLKGMGHFPPRKKPEQIWAGVVPNESLTILHNRVDSALVRAGMPKDSRKFTPHVTLAHMRATRESRVAGFIAEYNLYQSEPFPVTEFQLFSSVLSSHGALHEIEAVYPLNGKGLEQP